MHLASPFPSRLRGQLALLVFITLAPLLVLGVYDALDARQQRIAQNQENALRVTQVAAAEQDQWIAATHYLLTALARVPAVRDGEPAACNLFLASLLNQYPTYANFGVSTTNGDIFCSAVPLVSPVNNADRLYFTDALATRDFAVGEYQIGRITGKATVNFGYPILDESGQLKAIAFAALDLAWLNRLPIRAQLPTGSSLLVIDRSGTILVHYPDPEKYVARKFPEASLVQAVARQGAGSVEAIGPDGIPRVYAFTPLRAASQFGMAYLSIGYPIDTLLAETSSLLANRVLLILLAGMLAIAGAWGFGEFSILRRVGALMRAIQRLGSGDLTARTRLPYRQGELGELARAFDEMAESLQARTEDREKAEEQIRRQLEHLTALHTIDTAIAGSTDLALCLNVVLERVICELRVDAAAVLLFNPRALTLEYVARRGFRSNHARRVYRIGEHNAGRVALERRISKIPDLRELERHFGVSAQKDEFVSYFGVPLIAKGQVNGVLEIFHRSRLEPDSEWLNFLEMLAGQTAIAIDNATLFDSLQQSNVNLSRAYETTLEGWSRALDLRDKETEGHTLRVTEMTLDLARGFGIGEEEIVHIRRGALLHDIGKMGIPDAILLKPGKLTDAEWEIMRRHPRFAYEMLTPIAYLNPALDIPYCHHEKWDGAGYPRGLKGDQIPLAARIFAIVDVYDALTSDRPYRAAWSKEKTVEHIRSLAGTHFDPRVAEVFLQMQAQEAK